MGKWITLCLGIAWLFATDAHAEKREIAIQMQTGYRHSAAVALFKRNLQLQGWHITQSRTAGWRVHLCPLKRGTTSICMQAGRMWRRFREPQKAMTPSTRARLYLLYFHMTRQSGRKGGRQCGCSPTNTKAKRRRKKRPPARRRARPTKPPKTGALPAKAKPKADVQRVAFVPAKRIAPIATPRPPAKPRKQQTVAKEDTDDFDDLMESDSIPKELASRKSEWGWWVAVGASGDAFYTNAKAPTSQVQQPQSNDTNQVMPGATLHLRTGWGRLGLYGGLHFHAFFISQDKSIMLFRPTFAFEWTFWRRQKLGTDRVSFGIQAGLATEHLISRATASLSDKYEHRLQLGPLLGAHLLWQWTPQWSFFWRSAFVLAASPDGVGNGGAGLLFQWRNTFGIQYRFAI